MQSGRRWVVDVDLAQFFDRVNHDILMGMLAKRIADRSDADDSFAATWKPESW